MDQRKHEELETLNSFDCKGNFAELIERSKELRKSDLYLKYLEFINRGQKYSIFNNDLVFRQKPDSFMYATKSYLKKEFNRVPKEGARPMIILAPLSPVLDVYDLLDTYGLNNDDEDLPDWIINSFKVEGQFSDKIWERTVNNILLDAILVERKDKSLIQAGASIAFFLREKEYKNENDPHIVIEINRDLNLAEAYNTLCHELAHVFLGHFGNDEATKELWPNRENLPTHIKEIEAETVAYFVCGRIGLETKSPHYIIDKFEDDSEVKYLCTMLISRVASKIEKMGKKNLKPKKSQQKNFEKFRHRLLIQL